MNRLHLHTSINPGSPTDCNAVIHMQIEAILRGDEGIANVHHNESIQMQEKSSSFRSSPSKPIAVE